MPAYIDGYLIDATVQENHTYESEVTKYPVESGSDITDNVRNKPIVITLEGIVSDNPIGQVAIVRNRSVVTPASSDSSTDFLPSDEALAKLIAVHNAKQPIVVETTLKRYDSMVMTNLEIPRDASTGAVLHFTATFEQVIIVTNNRLFIRVASPNMAGKKNVIRSAAGFEVVKAPTITTKSGKTAIFDSAKGSYVYGDSLPGGAPVPNTDMPNTDSTGTVIGGTPTHWDPASNQWHNQDGTPVSKYDMEKADGTGQWWKDAFNPTNYPGSDGF